MFLQAGPGRLGGKLAVGAGTCTSNTENAGQGTSGTCAAMVLSQLLERADAKAGDLAKAYDRARITGQACESAYVAIGDARITP